MGKRFHGFIDQFADHFRLRTRDVCKQAWQYVQGLMQARKKNMERMAEVVPGSDDQVLQHFLSNSRWDERGVLDQVLALGLIHLGCLASMHGDADTLSRVGAPGHAPRVKGSLIFGSSS